MRVQPMVLPSSSMLAFARYAFGQASQGSLLFFVWMLLLTGMTAVGLNAWANQVVAGMQVTGLSNHVTWGLYIAHFTFFDGIAAASVLMVIPAYLFRDREMHDVVIVGMLLAIAAIIICLCSVTVDLGRPERFWHMVPFLGRFNWPISMLTWDVIVLNVYLFLNVGISAYLLWCRWRAQEPKESIYKPFVFLSIIWAVTIQMVIAFLYSGLGGRSFWNSALLAPRFLVSAFVAGPALIILVLLALQRLGSYPFGDKPVALLVRIVRFTALANLLMLAAECFTVLYSGSSHAASLQYLLFGLHGHTGLVPWMWTAIVFNIAVAALFAWPSLVRHRRLLGAACAMAFAGVWIEKGMGLIVPGFIPSSLHELVEYAPSLAEWKITVGITAGGLLLFTLMLKVALPLLAGWTPGLAVGVGALDDQHREIFARLNQLVAAIRSGQGGEAAQSTLCFLQGYVQRHFSDEEALLEASAYPGLAAHQAEHRSFCQELITVQEAMDKPGADRAALAEHVHLILRAWLTEHIRISDRAYASFLIRQRQQMPQAS